MCEKKGDEGESGETFLWRRLGKSSMETKIERSGLLKQKKEYRSSLLFLHPCSVDSSLLLPGSFSPPSAPSSSPQLNRKREIKEYCSQLSPPSSIRCTFFLYSVGSFSDAYIVTAGPISSSCSFSLPSRQVLFHFDLSSAMAAKWLQLLLVKEVVLCVIIYLETAFAVCSTCSAAPKDDAILLSPEEWKF
ncbi:hypothetical protein LguiA_002021 [Lonicera macranthoides]